MDFSSYQYSNPYGPLRPAYPHSINYNYDPYGSNFAPTYAPSPNYDPYGYNFAPTYASSPSPSPDLMFPTPLSSPSPSFSQLPGSSFSDHYRMPPITPALSALSYPSPYMYSPDLYGGYGRSRSHLHQTAAFLHSSRFHLKLLPDTETADQTQTTHDVLCQVGLDGIRMFDPSTNRPLRRYPLGDITRVDVPDSSTFAFWFKCCWDLEAEPTQIRLQSNTYTTNALLYSVIAATEQFKEMGGRSESVEPPEQPTERKNGPADWIEPVKEERDHWVPDEAVNKCSGCGTDFGFFVRKHHCRECGNIFCGKCSRGRITLTVDENAQPVRVCDPCMAEVSKRVRSAKETAAEPTGLQSLEEVFAKKVEEVFVEKLEGIEEVFAEKLEGLMQVGRWYFTS